MSDADDKRHMRKQLLTIALVTLVCMVIGVLAVTLVGRMSHKDNEQFLREAMLSELHSKVRFDMYRLGLQKSVQAVYGCNAGKSLDVPCPDYTAKIQFHGNSQDHPPTLHSVRDAQGEQVIMLTSLWVGSGWEVSAFYRKDVYPFAVNETSTTGRWSGPVYAPAIPPVLSTDTNPGSYVEFYAADANLAVVGQPLGTDRLG